MATALKRRRYLVAAILAIALVTLVLVGGRAAWRLGQRVMGPPPPPRETDVTAIAGWMSVPYVARAYRVPPDELNRALGIDDDRRRRQTLDDIARETGRSSEEVIEIVRATVSEWQATHRGPGPDGEPKPGGRPPAVREPEGAPKP